MRKLLIAMPVFKERCPDALELLRKHGVECIFQNTQGPVCLDDYEDQLEEIEAVITGTESFWGAEEMDRIKNLKIIARFGVGYDNVDVKEAARRGIICTNAPDGNRNAVAEFTVALLLSLIKRIPESYNILKQGGWAKIQGIELKDKTVGFIGFGAIARRVAELLVPFNVRFIAYDPFPRSGEIPVQMVTLPALLKESDIVLIHAAGIPETQNLICERELKLMKPSAYLINMSRGGVVNEQDLYNALQKKQIAGAASDVFVNEGPGASSQLLELDNFIGTCHIAGSSVEASSKIGLTVSKAVIDVLEGRTPQNIIQP